MKKYILSLALCLLAATSCLKDSTFEIYNYADFVTSYSGKLLSDYGDVYTVTSNATESEEWKIEGKRFYIICDILNRALAIKLKEITNVTVAQLSPLSEADKWDDPVIVNDHCISGGYLNIVMSYFYDKSSKYAHKLYFRSEYDGADDHLTIHIFHNGNHENPAYMAVDDLDKKQVVYSVPLTDFIKEESRLSLSVSLHELEKDAEGKEVVKKNTYHLVDEYAVAY
ncbi:MAG: hypothetical protein J6X99_06055 [Bacteroidales bacterium]|nr:hypothetical protein [Bacteroidales bacterium]